MNMHSAATLQRDLEWVDYLKAIGMQRILNLPAFHFYFGHVDVCMWFFLHVLGGPENLKPAGIFKPSDDLKVMVRRGVPVAYRSLVWQKLSLSSLHR